MIVPRAEREGLVSFCPEEGLWSLDIELMCKASLADTKPIRMLRERLSVSKYHSDQFACFRLDCCRKAFCGTLARHYCPPLLGAYSLFRRKIAFMKRRCLFSCLLWGCKTAWLVWGRERSVGF